VGQEFICGLEKRFDEVNKHSLMIRTEGKWKRRSCTAHPFWKYPLLADLDPQSEINNITGRLLLSQFENLGVRILGVR